MTTLSQNIRFGFRRFFSNPALSLIIVVTLALGIGANTTIFSVVNAMLLRPIPYPTPDRLVTINHHYPGQELIAPVSIRGFRNYRDNTSYFEETGISTGWPVNLTGEGEPERLTAGRVTSGYLPTFGLALAEGRHFTPDEETPGNNRVVIISDGFWKRRLGSIPDVINSELQLNSETFTIVGLMPPGFEDYFNRERELWTPLALTAEQIEDQGYLSEWLSQAARVREGVSIETVRQELVAMAEGLKEASPDEFPPTWTLMVTSLDERAKEDYRTSLLILAGAVGLVLLITCANVANILLARAIGRRKEIAIRGALGAGRGQIMQQLLSESVILAGAGGILGLLLAMFGIRAVVALGPPGFDNAGISIDLSVLLFTLLLSLLVGVIFGLIPALQISRTDIQSTLREGGHRSHADRSGRLRKVLVAGEFAISLALLTGAGLLIQTMAGLQKVDPGFDPENILTANISLPVAKYADRTEQQAFYRELLPRLEALPGVEAASTTDVLPFGGSWSTSTFSIEGYNL
ncbi:ABC transporter permease, partial [Gemmatimonadota bacterium]